MRLVLVISLISIMQTFALSAYTQNTKISLSVTGVGLEEIITRIENDTYYRFAYDKNDINVNKVYSVDVKNLEIKELLTQLFSDGEISYAIIGRQIVLSISGKPTIAQQSVTISGKITDSSGVPLPGVTVVVKGTTQGTITNDDGNYSLPNVPVDGTLVFSFVGIKSQEVVVGSQTNIDVEMEEDAVGVEEVVVVGYGVQKKINVTGAVSTVSEAQLQERPVTSVAEALQGVVPNLQINTTDGGRPGSDLSWQIRGNGSIGGSDDSPLILIDGIPGNPSLLNPDDIESISVLKDAAASSIYGSRAPYGVVIITTKRGKAREMQVNFNANLSWRHPTQLLEPMTSLEYMNYSNEGAKNLGISPYYPQYQIDSLIYRIENPGKRAPRLLDETDPTRWGYPVAVNTDWWKAIYQSAAPTQDYNITASGGSEKIRYYSSLGYLNQEGLYRVGTDQYKRYTGRLNLDVQPTDWLEINLSTQVTRKDNSTPYAPEMARIAFRSWPIYPVKEANGQWSQYAYALHMAEAGAREITVTDIFRNTVGFVIKPFEGFRLNGNASFNSMDERFRRNNKILYTYYVNGEDILGTQTNANQSFIEKQYSSNKYYSANVYADYTKQLNGHYFHALAGFQQENEHWYQLYGYRDDLISEEVLSLHAATGDNAQTNDGENEWAVRGYFGRINYNYKEKYLLEANLRYDGSSRFPADLRWGWFPSASIGYNISREPFFSALGNTISLLKFRASYGRLGNANVSNYYQPTMSKGVTDWIGIDGTFVDYVTAPGFGAYTITWEKPTTFNIGVDAGLFDNRLQVAFDWYRRTTTDMIGPPEPLPAVLGAAQPKENNTELKGTGWEFTLGYKGSSGHFHYQADLNVSGHREVVTKYYNPNGLFTTYYEGMVLGEVWGFETVGIIQNEETLNTMANQSKIYPNYGLGDIRYKDQNGDGEITRGSRTLDDPGDYVIIGNETPDFEYNIMLNLGYKGFDMRVFFTGIGPTDWWPNDGQGTWNSGNNTLFTFFGNSNNRWNHGNYKDHLDYWTPENRDAYYPRVLVGQGDPGRRNREVQTGYLLNRAYLRMKNLQFGYTFPRRWMESYFVRSARVYVSGEDLFTITNFRMFDPETPGLIYPLQKVYSIGIKLTF